MEAEAVLTGFGVYLDAEIRLSRQTVDTYLTECRIYLDYLSEHDLCANKVEGRHLIDFFVWRQLNGVRQRTIAKSLSCIRSFYRYLVLSKEINHNPAELIETPKIEKKIPRVFSYKEIQSFFHSNCVLENMKG